MLGLTQSLSISLGLSETGIRVNAILPGWIDVGDECKEADESQVSGRPAGSQRRGTDRHLSGCVQSVFETGGSRVASSGSRWTGGGYCENGLVAG